MIARVLIFEVPTPTTLAEWRIDMDVMFERVAGLDVHKAMVVATVRVVSDGKVKRECRTFETTTAGLWSCWAG